MLSGLIILLPTASLLAELIPAVLLEGSPRQIVIL